MSFIGRNVAEKRIPGPLAMVRADHDAERLKASQTPKKEAKSSKKKRRKR